MKDIVAGKIIGFCNLSLTGWFFIPLFQHDPGTFQAKLNSRKGVDAVINTAVIRHIATGHSTVRRIDDSIALQCSNITLPEIDTFLHWFQIQQPCDRFSFCLFFQISILYRQKFRIGILRHADIHESTQQQLLLLFSCRNVHILIFRMLF